MSKRVVIDAGHGGNDSGASGNGIVEKDYTLNISEYIHERLDELGVPNVMVRTGDETLEPSDRITRIKSFYGDGNDVLLVSNHINAGGGEGSEIIYALRNKDTFSKMIADELENSGRTVRKYYQRRYPSDSSKDYYFIHRNTGNIEPVIVEYGFLDNINDANLLKNYWMDYAEAVVKAICNYLGVPYSYSGEMSNPNYYIVQKGDSLWSIAKKYGLSVEELKDLNHLSSNMLQVGEKLLVKDTSSSTDIGVYYTVVAGDTLYGIAKKYNTTADEIKKLNNLKSNTLSIGQKLLVSGTGEEQTDYDIYTVVSGDNLYQLATKFNTTVDKLKDINNLKTDSLMVGQKLLVPKSLGNTTYIVKSGDTLYSISRLFNTTVTDLVNLNHLTTSNLSIGQKLLIPR